jgi:ribosomal protein S27E
LKFSSNEYEYLGRSAGTPKAVRMVKVSPRRLASPKAEDAVVLDPVSDDAPSYLVSVARPDGGYVFEFIREGQDLVGRDARSAKPWAVVTDEWLAAAWGCAAEALRRHLSGSAQPQNVRCGECGRVIPVPAEAPSPVAEVLCGTKHVLTFGGEKAAVVAASGAVTWALVQTVVGATRLTDKTLSSPCCGAVWHWAQRGGMRLYREADGRKVYDVRCAKCSSNYVLDAGPYLG